MIICKGRYAFPSSFLNFYSPELFLYTTVEDDKWKYFQNMIFILRNLTEDLQLACNKINRGDLLPNPFSVLC